MLGLCMNFCGTKREAVSPTFLEVGSGSDEVLSVYQFPEQIWGQCEKYNLHQVKVPIVTPSHIDLTSRAC